MSNDYKFLYNALILINLNAVKHCVCYSNSLTCQACSHKTCSMFIPLLHEGIKCKPKEWMKKGLIPSEMRNSVITLIAYCNTTKCANCHLKDSKNTCLLTTRPLNKFTSLATRVKELIK